MTDSEKVEFVKKTFIVLTEMLKDKDVDKTQMHICALKGIRRVILKD